MGFWQIVIHGMGPHNNNAEYDADKIAARVTDELRSVGQTLFHSVFTSGGGTDLLTGNPSGYPAAETPSPAESVPPAPVDEPVPAPVVPEPEPPATPPTDPTLPYAS